MVKLSVALATFNEEANLGKCLESVKNIADEIVVVDGSSTDKTVEIASSIGRSASGRKKPQVKVIVTDNPPIFHINKQKAIDQCSGDWILQLDADEEITLKLAGEIKEIVKKGSRFSAFWIKRKNFFLGRWLKKGGQYPDPVIRLFKKGRACLPCKSVHEQMEVEGKIGWLEHDMLHFSVPTFSRYLTNSNRYTSLAAYELKERNLRFSLFNHLNYLLIKPGKTFLSLYFRHKGFLDGFPGFIFALFSGLHFPTAYIKLWELKIKKK